MIDTTTKTMLRRGRDHLIEGWIERVDAQNRRLHVRTGSRDRIGASVQVPEDCEIHHEGYHLGLQSLLPCDAVNIRYSLDAEGVRLATNIELTA
jgi:hypothetical protein